VRPPACSGQVHHPEAVTFALKSHSTGRMERIVSGDWLWAESDCGLPGDAQRLGLALTNPFCFNPTPPEAWAGAFFIGKCTDLAQIPGGM
jgi:hypothetical protein